MKRRDFIGIFAAGATAGLSGCIEPISGVLEDDPPSPPDYVDDWQEEDQPATGDPITVETDEIDDTESAAAEYAQTILREKLTDQYPDVDRLSVRQQDGELVAHRFFIEGRSVGEMDIPVAFDELQAFTPASITVIIEGGAEYRFDVYVGDSYRILY